MLRELSIENVAVIRSALLQPGAGFTVLSGETGAGKSMCLAALRLALGGRADPATVRAGAETARVRAVFEDPPKAVRTRLDELGIPQDDLLALSREIGKTVRGACRVNGSLVSSAVLREIGDQLVDVTAQGASQRLLRPAAQRSVLDDAGGEAVAAALRRTGLAVGAWRAARAELAAAQQAAGRSAETVAAARDIIADLDPLNLISGEDQALVVERARLRHAAAIRAALSELADAGGGEGGAADVLAAVLPGIEDAAALDTSLEPLVEAGTDLVERARELRRDCLHALDTVSLDSGRLAEVDERLDLLARVTRRFGSLDAGLAALAAARRTVDAAEGRDRVDELSGAVECAAAEAASAAAELSRLRRAAARTLERQVSGELHRLELPHARFRVLLGATPAADGLDLGDGLPVRCHEHGTDDVEFRLATHRDMLPAPLGEGPSGGELSRLALALSSVVAESEPVCLVLDEVDTGIGGETAARVGDTLAAIGGRRQVIAVTHRAEVAARASDHLVLRRGSSGAEGTATAIAVQGDERVDEIARLLSGRLTAAARARARELLHEGSAAEPAPRRPRRAASTM
ncbi:MAG: AAA family ATPase [Candidatus Dormibacteraeota bacterium]|nr:AAA family ATPase [Candidatus Dormibacteraeota bacterium]